MFHLALTDTIKHKSEMKAFGYDDMKLIMATEISKVERIEVSDYDMNRNDEEILSDFKTGNFKTYLSIKLILQKKKLKIEYLILALCGTTIAKRDTVNTFQNFHQINKQETVESQEEIRMRQNGANLK